MSALKTIRILILSSIVSSMALSVAGAQNAQVARMQAALASPERSAEAKARDEIRKPIDVIRFLGIKDGDRVIDVISFGGWYTEVLSAAVGPQGHVYTQNPDFFVSRPGFADTEQALVARLGNVTAVHGDLPKPELVGQLDAAITALNLHDIFNSGGKDAAVALLTGIRDVLKPGGVLGIIDHRGIAGQPNNDFHRIQEADARSLLEAAGFVVEASSDVLANPADDHMRPTRDESLQRRTDRFVLRARKP
jgi:predicted methyltransferase